MILASASPRRLELLRACGISVSVRPADVDETRQEGESPTHLVRRLARSKAHAAREALEEGLLEPLVAADTIVWDDQGDVLGKPHDSEDAARMLHALSGKTHHVSTGVCVLVPRTNSCLEACFVETTDVTFCQLSEHEVAAYVASGEPMDKAGAYGIQGLGRLLVSEIRGDYPNVVGLPVNRTLRTIDELSGMAEDGLVVTALGGNHA
jgi:septum formation protein